MNHLQFAWVTSGVNETYVSSFFCSSASGKNECYAERRQNWLIRLCRECCLATTLGVCRKVHVRAEKSQSVTSFSSQHFLSFIYHLHKNHRVSLSFCPCEGFIFALITVGIIIRCHVHVKKVLQFPLQGLECGPVLFFLLPAVHHYVIHDFRAVGRTWHPVAQRNPLDHLQVCHGYNNHSTQLRTFIKRNTSLSVESMYKRIEKAHLGKASVQRS